MIKQAGLLTTLFLLPLICLAEPPENYQALHAVQKQQFLWRNVLNSEYSSLPVEDSLIPNPDLLNPFYLLGSFTNTSDELPVGRKKLIHAYGSTAKISIKITNPKYAGIFETGGIGIARLSIARMSNAKTAFTPGMAIKVLVDGEQSINLHVMNSVDGQGADHYFFSRAFSNILPEPTSFAGKLIGDSFNIAVDLLNHYMNGNGPESAANLPLLQACQLKAPESSCPYQIIFRPIGDPGGIASKGVEDDFRKDLAKIQMGTAIYSIHAVGTPGEAEETIGLLVTTSRFVASSYGDEKLFFSHASLGR